MKSTFVIFALATHWVYAGQPPQLMGRLLNSAFLNNGSIKPRASAAADPPPTSIIIDTTLCGLGCNASNSGPISATPPADNLYAITPSYGVSSGVNEFFSFQTFNVGTGDTAQFGAPSTTQNIISRVTGGASSTIAGQVTTVIGSGTSNTTQASTANFWFINPAGVILTAGAEINVSGAIALAAADYVGFANGDRWYVIDSNGTAANPSVLSTSNPINFGFLAINPATGILTDDADLTSTGNIILASRGTLTIENGANLNAQTEVGTPGGIMLESETGVILNNAILALQDLSASPSGQATPGNISIFAPSILISGGSVDSSSIGGAITINANNSYPGSQPPGPVTITNGATIDSSSAGFVNGGDIDISGASILVSGSGTKITSSAAGVSTQGAGTGIGISSGNITLYASGPDPQGGGYALQVTGGASIAATVNDQSAINQYGNAGTISLQAPNGTVSVDTVAGTAPLSQTQLTASELSTYGGYVGAIDVGAKNVIISNAEILTSTQSPSTGSLSGSGIDVNATSTVTISGAEFNATTAGSENASNLQISGSTVSITNSQVLASTSGTGNAGNIVITASGADPGGGAVALQVSAGSTVSSDATNGIGGAAAGNVTLIASTGTVEIGLPADSAATTISTAAGSSAGSVGQITIQGVNATLNGAQVTATTGSGTNPTTSGPAISIAATTGYVSITGGSISSETFASANAADISISGTEVTMNEGAQVLATTTGTGNAGNIVITASGADPGGGADALQVTGGSNVSSNALQGSDGAAAGNVTITASNGTAEIGLPTDSAVTTISTAGGPSAGSVGDIAITGSAIAMSNANVNTSSAGEGTISGEGLITLSSGRALSIVNSVVDASTSGAQQGGQIDVSGSRVAINNSQVTAATTGSGNAGNISLLASGPDLPGSVALQVAGGTVISSDAYYDQNLANAGDVTLTAGRGTVQVGLATDSAPTQLLSRAGADAGEVGNISVTGASVALDQAELLALSQSNVSPSASQPAVSIIATGPVSLVASVLNSNTSGSANSGDISVIGSTVAMSGSSPLTGLSLIEAATLGVGNAGNIMVKATGADPPGGAALQLTGGSSISSESELAFGNAGPGGNAGSITLIANDGTVEIASTSTRTSLTTLASANAGAAGAISITANQIELNDAFIDTSVSTTNAESKLAPASVTLSASAGVSLTNSLIDLESFGTVDAGSVSITGSTISISGGLELAPIPNSPFAFPLNTAIFTGSSGTGNGGSVAISAAGLLTVSNATISGQSVGSTGYGGQISLVGSGVLISDQSLISADYANPGGNPGAAGSVTVRATGTVSVDDPLQNDTSEATSGVIRLVDSGVTASNNGGIGSGGNIGSFGQVSLGGGSTDNIVILGSVVSTDVLNNGVGNNLTIEGNRGVFIGQSSSGGFADPIPRPTFPDPRSSISGSLISAQTDATASSGGEITIQSDGALGVTVSNSNIDSGTTRVLSGIAISAPFGPVELTDTVMQSNTSSANRSGNITISAPAIAMQGGTITAKTSASGEAGDIVVTATGADGASGSVALTVTNGGSITSDSLSGNGGADAGTVTLSASNGSIQIGGSLGGQQTEISTAAGKQAGQAGTILISAAKDVTVSDALVDTSVAALTPTNSQGLQYAPGTVTLKAGGQIAIAGSILKAVTSGEVPAGDINLTAGQTLDITSPAGMSRSLISSSSTSTAGTAGAAGRVTLSGSTISIDATDVTATVDGGDASTGPANITLTANGPVAVTGGATINADSSGMAPGGSIELLTPGAVSVQGAGTSISSNTSGAGIGGDIDFGTVNDASSHAAAAPIASLLVSGGAVVSVNASGTGSGAGHGGTLLINAAGPVTLSGTGTTLSSASSGNAFGGSVTIDALSLSMNNGAVITADTSSTPVSTAAAAVAGTRGAGGSGSLATGGDIDIRTSGAVALTNPGTAISANAFEGGSGGEVNISAAALTLTDGARITTTANGAGNSGAISITLNPAVGVVTPILLAGNSEIETSAASSTGGDITINAGGSPLTLSDSVINATAGAAGNGGNITISEVGQTILSDSAILARADSGNGGAINIFSIPGALFIEDSESLISAQSKTGNSGTVNINAPQTDLNSGLAVPEVSVARAAQLSSNACRHERNHSTFVREGQGGITQDPDGYLTGQSMNGTAPASSAPAKATKNRAPADRAPVLAAAAASPGCW